MKEVRLDRIHLTDAFWKERTETVRKKVIPYQWNALNDAIPEAEKSYCIRNFQTAKRVNRLRRQGVPVEERSTKDFISLPEGNALLPGQDALENDFYGFVFQDSDLYKWIEASAYSLTTHPDQELEKTIDSMVELMEEAMLEDGYLDTFYIIKNPKKRFTNLRDHHELYCFGHMAEAAAAYYEATGKKKLLELAMRFADHICDHFGSEEGKCHGYPGHELAEMALIRLYDCTGKEKYKELSHYFVTQRGQKPNYFLEEHQEKEGDMRYYQAHEPVADQKEAVGHAVRAMYFYSAIADLAREEENHTFYQIAKRLWNDVTQKKMYITGGVGATHIGEAFSYAYDLPSDTAYAETCAAIGLVFFAHRMLLLEPKAEYADVMERALYNGVLSGISLDGTSFFYVNPLEVNPAACQNDKRIAHIKARRSKWFGCACCPPNLARLTSSIAKYIFTKEKDCLWIHLYVGCDMDFVWNGQTVHLSMESNLPWSDRIAIRLQAQEEMKGTIALRIPGWAGEWSIETDQDTRLKDGYLYIDIKGQKELLLTPQFQIEPVFYRANTMVRETSGQIALGYGPLIYCLEEADNGKNLHLLEADIDAVKQAQKIALPFINEHAVGFRMKGSRLIEEENASLYCNAGKEAGKKEEWLTWIPYFAWANREEGEMRVWISK